MNTTPTKERCCARVHESGRGVGFHPCAIPATVERAGKHYCRIHDPEAVRKRDKIASDKYSKQNSQRQKEYAAIRACAGIDNPEEAIAKAREALRLCRDVLDWIAVQERDLRDEEDTAYDKSEEALAALTPKP